MNEDTERWGEGWEDDLLTSCLTDVDLGRLPEGDPRTKLLACAKLNALLGWFERVEGRHCADSDELDAFAARHVDEKYPTVSPADFREACERFPALAAEAERKMELEKDGA